MGRYPEMWDGEGMSKKGFPIIELSVHIENLRNALQTDIMLNSGSEPKIGE